MALQCYYLIQHPGGKIQLQMDGHLRLHIDCIRVGVGKPKRYKPLPSHIGWWERRTEERDRKFQELLASSLGDVREAEEEEARRPENILFQVEQRIARQQAEERKSRASKEEQRLRAFTALQMIGKPRGTIRERKLSRTIAGIEARRREADWRRKKDREDEIDKQRLLTEKKEELRQEKIRAQRLANLKKARAAKKRKRKKK